MSSTITLVRHRVANFDAWKTEYNNSAPLQTKSGVRATQVLRSGDDPNDILVSHTFDSSEAAHAFMAKPELKDAMKRAGVNADSISISYFDEVEARELAAR